MPRIMGLKLRVTHLGLVFATLLPGCVFAGAQQTSPAVQSGPQSILLDVSVTPKSGAPVTGLTQQDFTLLDNKTPQPIASFKAVSAAEEPVSVVVLLDAVNIDFSRVSYARQQLQKFLKANGGKLDHPTTIAVLTDQGTQVLQKNFTTDGLALSAALDHDTIGLRDLRRDAGFWGANERLQISLKAMQQLAATMAGLPGRKVAIWVSPGWPLLTGPRVDLDGKQQQQIFGNVVAFSRELQMAHMTLYNVNPLGPEENLFREDYYQAFVKGVSNPSQTDLADLSLQVLAVQSGGLSLNGSSDVAGGLRKCYADTDSWYEVGFPARSGEQANEYNSLQVNVDKPGLTARSRNGYYAQP